MAVQRTFQAIITVLDRTAAPLRAIQGRLRGLAPATLTVGQNLRLVRDRLVALAQSPAMQNLGNSVALVGRRFSGLLGTMRRVGMGFVALAATAGVSVGALVGMGRATLDAAGRLSDLVARTGMTVEQIRGLEHAAMMAGLSSSEAAIVGMERLNRAMGEAAGGSNKDVAAIFRQLGISLRDNVTGNVRAAIDVLPELADAFQRNTNQVHRNLLANELFSRGGAPLIAALVQGGDALRAQMADGFRLNPQINSANIGAIDASEDAVARLGVAVVGVRDAIFTRLLPALEPLITRLTEWTRVNQDIIGEDVAGWVSRVATQVSQWDIAGFVDAMKGLAASAQGIVAALGGMENTLIGLAAIALTPLISALVSLGAALVKIVGLALALSPAGWVVAGIAALAALGVTLYNNWKAFADLIDRIVTALRSLQGGGLGRPPDVQQEQRSNFGQRGRVGGFYAPGPLLDPDTGEPAFGPNVRPQSAPAPPATRGAVDVRVRFDDLPRGARVDASGTGNVNPPRLDVGYATLGVP